jgi:hypothetical protein
MTKSNFSGRRLGEGLVGVQKQRGMSFIAVFIILAVVLFFATAAFKIGPSYMEYMTVAKIAEDVSRNSEVLKGSKSKVNKYINQAYRTNNLWDLKAEDTVELKKDGRRGYTVKVNYEKRMNLVSNIDVVTVFQKDLSE